jgi:hypothetical protein
MSKLRPVVEDDVPMDREAPVLFGRAIDEVCLVGFLLLHAFQIATADHVRRYWVKARTIFSNR